jgi:hypothetical protein
MGSSFASDDAPPLLTAWRQETNALDHFQRRAPRPWAIYLVPALALGIGYLVLGEMLGFLALAGGAVTILGVILVRKS